MKDKPMPPVPAPWPGAAGDTSEKGAEERVNHSWNRRH
jgi:hypothetical protein